MAMHGDSAIQPPDPFDLPHWNRDARTRKRRTHLAVSRARACDHRPVKRRDYLRSADLDPSMPVCETCWRRWIEQRNAARKATP